MALLSFPFRSDIDAMYLRSSSSQILSSGTMARRLARSSCTRKRKRVASETCRCLTALSIMCFGASRVPGRPSPVALEPAPPRPFDPRRIFEMARLSSSASFQALVMSFTMSGFSSASMVSSFRSQRELSCKRTVKRLFCLSRHQFWIFRIFFVYFLMCMYITAGFQWSRQSKTIAAQFRCSFSRNLAHTLVAIRAFCLKRSLCSILASIAWV
mmetsp:Transcript_73990/g.216746  ORF Transcript_73990/g.216746 Transcript_73990/m.216746 type:complete len:213 (+) Transcript_73990:484-1122(+)